MRLKNMTKELFEKQLSECKGNSLYLFLNDERTFSTSRDIITCTSTGVESHDWYGELAYGIIVLVTNSSSYIRNNGNRPELGSDPELFFVKDGSVVPSSLVVPEDYTGKVIRDGFQGELNPSSNTCRQSAGTYIGQAFLNARSLAKKVGAEISLSVGHVIPDNVWKGTPMSMRRFGCNPTTSAYDEKHKRVTGLRERFRAAGGHIHIGLGRLDEAENNKIVQMMDIIAGNTCVLIDRDPDNARRRKNYGRAGEYRPKSYGIEYRVLSNFWLKSYTLWSLASSLVRTAYNLYRLGEYDDLVKRFDMNKVHKAINDNNYELALENFKIYAEYVKEKRIIGGDITIGSLDNFTAWATSEDPLKDWDTLAKTVASWDNKVVSTGEGIETYLLRYKV